MSLVGKDVFGWVMQWISVMKSCPESVRCYVSWSLWGSHKDILSLQAASSVNGRDAFGYPHGSRDDSWDSKQSPVGSTVCPNLGFFVTSHPFTCDT